MMNLVYQGEPCDICGDVGFSKCLVTCNQCKSTREHVYCMRRNSLIIPSIWDCENCCRSSNCLVEERSPSEASKLNDATGQVRHENKEGLPYKDDSTDKAFCSASLTTEPQSCITLYPSRRKSRTPRKVKKFSNKKLSDDAFKISGTQERHLSYNLRHFEKYPSNSPNLDAVWNGSFEVLDMLSPGELYVGFRAHLPRVVDHKVHEFSKQMPQVLQFKLLPRSDIWAKIFQNDSAFGYDISLYFFPENFERSLQQYVCLLGFIEMQDLVLKSCINGVELLVFTSKQLHFAKELNWISFLWGIFRIVKKENAVAVPSFVPAHNDHKQTLNFESTVRQLQLVEVKNEDIDGLNVTLGSSKETVSKVVHDLELKNLSLDLVEVPVEYHQWGVLHLVKSKTAYVTPSSVRMSKDFEKTIGSIVQQPSSGVNIELIQGLYVLPDFCENAPSKATNSVILEKSFSNLVEVPIRNDQIPGLASDLLVACSTSCKKEKETNKDKS